MEIDILKIRLALLKRQIGLKSRLIRRELELLKANRRGRAIFCNSFPKSGTHLLLQVLEGIPELEYYGKFVTSASSYGFKDIDASFLGERFKRMLNNEIVLGHLKYDDVIADQVTKACSVSIFVVRDPRDVVISEANYLAKMNPWHRLHPFFRRDLKTDGDRIEAAIRGLDSRFDGMYPDFAKRFADFRGWLGRKEVITVRFEDFVGGQTYGLTKIMEAFRDLECVDLTIDEATIKGNMVPKRSHTFNVGTSGRWRGIFEPRHYDAMKEICGDLLVELGYEENLDW